MSLCRWRCEIIRKNDLERSKKVYADCCENWTEYQYIEAETLVSGIEYATLMTTENSAPLDVRISGALNQIMGIYGVPEETRKMKIAGVLDMDYRAMLCLKFNGEKSVLMKEITVAVTVENIQVITDFINEQLEAFDCPMKAQTQIDIAVDEIFSNIAHYAYTAKTGDATVRIEIGDNPQAAAITFIDSGVPYNPLTQAEPDITLSAEERQVGGLGIFIVKNTMDEITYEYKDGMNILKIRKNFS